MTLPVPAPRITVVTPSYNQGRYLEATIRSVLLQDYPNLEYIVLDGGSTDGSTKILERYGSRLAYWQSEPDRGQAHAINLGMQRATGQILCWLNSDDLLLPGALRRVATALSDAREPAWVVGACGIVGAGDQAPAVLRRSEVSFETLFDWHNQWIAQQAVFWTRALWERAGPLDETLHYAMDVDLWFRMSRLIPPQLVADEIAVYRWHEAAKCRSNPHAMKLELNRVAERYYPALPPEQRGPVRQTLDAMLLEQVRTAYKDLNFSAARRGLWQLATTRPVLLLDPRHWPLLSRVLAGPRVRSMVRRGTGRGPG